MTRCSAVVTKGEPERKIVKMIATKRRDRSAPQCARGSKWPGRDPLLARLVQPNKPNGGSKNEACITGRRPPSTPESTTVVLRGLDQKVPSVGTQPRCSNPHRACGCCAGPIVVKIFILPYYFDLGRPRRASVSVQATSKLGLWPDKGDAPAVPRRVFRKDGVAKGVHVQQG